MELISKNNRNVKQKKCRFCERLFYPIKTTAIVCSYECANLYAVQERDKKTKKDWQKKKKVMKEKLMSKSDWMKIAQSHFNHFIRLRDAGNDCISCGKKPLKQNAGHYFSLGGHSAVRFDEYNVHLQCEYCNTYLSGNLHNYRENLIRKIGEQNFSKLCDRAKAEKRFSIEEIKSIIDLYKEKVKIRKKWMNK